MEGGREDPAKQREWGRREGGWPCWRSLSVCTSTVPPLYECVHLLSQHKPRKVFGLSAV